MIFIDRDDDLSWQSATILLQSATSIKERDHYYKVGQVFL